MLALRPRGGPHGPRSDVVSYLLHGRQTRWVVVLCVIGGDRPHPATPVSRSESNPRTPQPRCPVVSLAVGHRDSQEMPRNAENPSSAWVFGWERRVRQG